MNKLYAGIGIAILVGLYTWWVHSLGVQSCQAKVDKTTTTQAMVEIVMHTFTERIL